MINTIIQNKESFPQGVKQTLRYGYFITLRTSNKVHVCRICDGIIGVGVKYYSARWRYGIDTRPERICIDHISEFLELEHNEWIAWLKHANLTESDLRDYEAELPLYNYNKYLNDILLPVHLDAGIRLVEEDDHTVCIVYKDKRVARFNSTTTIKDLREEADRIVEQANEVVSV
jgi:hypothetical protein